jgi:hypothetical protein
MKTKIALVLALVIGALVSCDNDNGIKRDDSLIFSYHCGGSWIGLNENLTITQKTIHYSISYRRLDTSEKVENEITVETPRELWKKLIEAFDLNSFKKIQDGQCQSCVDGFDQKFTIIQNGMEDSIYNGYNDENYKKMQEFFDVFLEQASIFNMDSSPSSGCNSFLVYKMRSNGYNDIGIAVSGNREKLNLSKTEQIFDLSKTDVQDLKVEIKKFTLDSRGYYCDCVFEGKLLDTWTSTSGTVKIKIAQDYEGNPSALEKIYTINVILENVVLKNDKGSTLIVEHLEFNDVVVGLLTG